jgi:hypothetical protein
VSEKPAPNVAFHATTAAVYFQDDPLEARMARNFLLMQQEHVEQEVRRQVLEDKLMAMEQMPSPDWLLQVREALERKNASLYCERARAMHAEAAASGGDPPLLHFDYTNLGLVLLSDERITGDDAVQHFLRVMDGALRPPDHRLDLAMSLPAKMHLTIEHMKVGLRRLPISLLEADGLRMHGTIAIVEPRALPSATYTVPVYLTPRNNVTLTRGMSPLKLYHALQMRSRRLTLAFGQSFDPIITHAGMAVDLLDTPGTDPSPPVPWFDKARLLRHGDFDMESDVFELKVSASADPSDDLDYLHGRLTHMRGWWRRSRLGMTGDGAWRIVTPSKFNRCPLHHWPGFALEATLHWMCFGNGDDHHSVAACAPQYARRAHHDGYRGFRSSRLEVDVDLRLGVDLTLAGTSMNEEEDEQEITAAELLLRQMAAERAEQEEGQEPCTLLYANTLSWLRRLQTSFGTFAVPVRRGNLYGRGGVLRRLAARSHPAAAAPYMVRVSECVQGKEQPSCTASLVNFLWLLKILCSCMSRLPFRTQGKAFKKPSFGEHLEEIRARLATPKLTVVYCNQYDGRESLFVPLNSVDFRVRYNNTPLPVPDPPTGVLQQLRHRPLRSWELSDGQAQVGQLQMYALRGEDTSSLSDEDALEDDELHDDIDRDIGAAEALRRDKVIFDLPAYVAEAQRTEAAFRTAMAAGDGQSPFGPYVEAEERGFRAPDGALWYHFFSCHKLCYNGCPPAEREMRHAQEPLQSPAMQLEESMTLAGLLPPPRRAPRSRHTSVGSESPSPSPSIHSHGERPTPMASAAHHGGSFPRFKPADSPGTPRMGPDGPLSSTIHCAFGPEAAARAAPWRLLKEHGRESTSFFACQSTSGSPRILIEPAVEPSSEGHIYAHSLAVHEGRMAWSMEVRRVVRAMWQTYREQRQLNFELSTAALRPEGSDSADDDGHR